MCHFRYSAGPRARSCNALVAMGSSVLLPPDSTFREISTGEPLHCVQIEKKFALFGGSKGVSDFWGLREQEHVRKLAFGNHGIDQAATGVSTQYVNYLMWLFATVQTGWGLRFQPQPCAAESFSVVANCSANQVYIPPSGQLLKLFPTLLATVLLVRQ